MDAAPRLCLDGDLFQTYASYKKATNHVIKWLTGSCVPGMARVCLSSVREMRHLTNQIISSRKDIPDELIVIFQKAVDARKRLTSFYHGSSNKADHEATETHVYFNQTFEEIYKDLAYAHKRSSRRWSQLSAAPTVDNSFALSNPFECLSITGDATEPLIDTCSECNSEKPSPMFEEPGSKYRQRHTGPAIEDDALEELASLHTYVAQLEGLTSTVEESYREVADGSIPLMVAALMSNCAYECSKSLGASIEPLHCGNPSRLNARYTCLAQTLTLTEQTPTNFLGDRLDVSLSPMLERLQKIWNCLKEFKGGLNSRHDLGCHSKCHKCDCNSYTFSFEDPADYPGLVSSITSKCERSTLDGDDDGALKSILRGLYQDLQLSKESDCRTMIALALLRDFEAFIVADSDTIPQSAGVDLCFGLHLLHRSYNSFFNAQPATDENSHLDSAPLASKRLPVRIARLHALKLSLNYMATLKSTLYHKNVPCTCFQANGTTVVSAIVTWHNILNRFVRTNRFDLLYQSPWVSGTHAVANLVQTSDLGSNLWHYGYFVGTVLHMYNAMAHAGLLDAREVPVLEAFCKMYDNVLFLGNRTTHNVLSCWQRWGGAKIMKTAHARNAACGPAEKKWRLCSVHDSTHGSGHWKRSYSPTKVSIFHTLAANGYALTDDVLTRIHQSLEHDADYKPTQASGVETTSAADRPAARTLEAVKTVVLNEFQDGTTPVARINHFPFYHACMRVMSKMSEVNHEEKLGYICKCPAEMCLRTCDVYLKKCLMASGPKPELVDCKVCNSCVEHILQEFGGVELKDFLWDVSLAS